jgi:hypothetical protein
MLVAFDQLSGLRQVCAAVDGLTNAFTLLKDVRIQEVDLLDHRNDLVFG